MGTEMQMSAPRRARRSGLMDCTLHREPADGLVWPWGVLPSARWDRGGGHGKGGCGYSCGRLGWEVARGQGLQICEELVSVSSTAGRAACLLHCLARRGREGALMLLCGAGRNAQSGGFETSWGGVWVFFQRIQTIRKDNRVELEAL